MGVHFVVSPAYGRDYKNAGDAKDAWMYGKDFVHESQMHTGGGMYISSTDCSPGDTVEIRYYNKRRATVMTRLEDAWKDNK